MSKHTPGRLGVVNTGDSIRLTNEEDRLIAVVPADEVAEDLSEALSVEARSNARRLVASWNACLDATLEDLEQSTVPRALEPTLAKGIRRILACLKECEGIPTEALEAGALTRFFDEVRAFVSDGPDVERPEDVLSVPVVTDIRRR